MPPNTDISIAIGPSWYHASSGYALFSPNESDSYFVNDASRSALYQIGIGYHLFANQLRDRRFFNDLLVQLNTSHSR